MITFIACAMVLAGLPALVPTPNSLVPGKGSIELRKPVIVATAPSLVPLAYVLAEEIETKTGVRPGVSSSPSRKGITLRLRAGGGPESYRIEVTSGVTIIAPTLKGISWGSVSLLQAIEGRGRITVPRLHIADEPAHPYRGLMIDVARRSHSIDVLKQCVVLCHLYKLGYLQLHLSDDQSFTFPSQAFPLINTQNEHGGPSYTLAELQGLVQFSDARGVTIIPEMDIPGHSATLVRTMPDLFKIKGTKPYEHHASINFVNPAVLRAVDMLIGEMCEVFHSSPYFHMGGDEADISLADQHPDFQAAFKELGLPDKSQQELYRRFLNQVNAMVKKRGKKLIVWEGFGPNPASKFPIDKDILVMEFENAYYLPTDLLSDGYSLVNASWTPLYVVNRHVWPARKVYDWDISQFGRFSNLYPTTGWYKAPNVEHIQGAQVCSWEGPEESEIENLRRLVPAMAERIWSSRAAPYDEFEARMKATDSLLEQLVHPVRIDSGPLDATDPSGFDVPCFSKPLTVSLHATRNGSVRFTTDGKPPTFASPEYSKPIELTQTTTIRAAVFNPIRGGRLGYESAKTFYYVAPHLPNLATGKKVTSSGGTQGPQTPELAVDDNLDLASSWWAAPGPQWLRVDLGGLHSVDRIEVFPYWDGRRYYGYTVEVSEGGLSWATVADRSANTKPASSQGDEILFEPQRVRFVKVNMLHGSANEGVHLVELRVWPAKTN